MFRCKNCGVVVDEYQYNNHDGLCPDCVRLVNTSSRPSGLQLGRVVNLQQSIETRENIGGMLFLIGCSGIGVPILLSLFSGGFGDGNNPIAQALPLILIFGIVVLIIGSLIFLSANNLKEEMKRL